MAADADVERQTRMLIGVSGLLATVLFVIGAGWLQLAGLEPIDANAETIRASVANHRESLLGCYVLWNVAIVVQLVFFGALTLDVYGAGYRLFTLLAALSASVLTALMFVGYVFLGALAFRAPALSAETSQVLSDLFYLLLSSAGFAGAVAATAFSLPMLRSKGLIRLVGWVGVASAVVHVEAAVALARAGAWSPAGWGGYVAPMLYIAWMFGVAVLYLRGKPLLSPSPTSI